MKNRKIALVTGGAQGIGACVADKMGSSGYTVIFCDIDSRKGRSREKELLGKGIDALFLEADVSSPRDVRKMFLLMKEKYERIDALVNNAGIADPSMAFPSDSMETWERVIGTNLSGSFYTANFISPLMGPGSSIVNIASTRAFQSEKSTMAYSASKGGIVALTHSLAITLSDRGIRVNCISPGWVDTSEWRLPPEEPVLKKIDHLQHPSGRVGKPEDIANMVEFLCSENGAWINGENIIIDGGMTKRMIYFDDETLTEIQRNSG